MPDTPTIADITSAVARGQQQANEVVAACNQRIDERNDQLNALIRRFDTQAQLETGADGALQGVPVALKDNLLVAGEAVTAGSAILQGYTASFDATAVTRLKEAGAVLIGATNMDEFAMGSSGEHSYYGATHNPHGTDRVPGGSSSGSAAAVAAGLVPAALGSDTGGSIRQPASFCGVVGLKPTYGSVSRSGLIAMGSSLDQIGPLTRTVADARTVLSVISGQDRSDSTTIPDDQRPSGEQATPETIGVPRDMLDEGVDADIAAQFEQNLEQLRECGYEIVDITLPNVAYALAAYYVIMPAEVSTNLARFDGVRYGLHREGDGLIGDYMETRSDGFGAEPRRRILLGTFVLSSGYHDAYYRQATAVRAAIRSDFDTAFSSVDAIATPTTPAPPFRIGETTDPLTEYKQDAFTVPANLAGIPALSVPGGTIERDGDQLPTGLQLMGPHLHEETLLSIGSRFLGES